MQGRVSYNTKRLTAGLLVLIMGLLMVNRALYIHIHVLPDGSLHSHAHPFSKSKANTGGVDHQHSSLEFLLLDQLDVITYCASALSVLMAFSPSITLGRPCMSHLPPSLVRVSPGRAPPTCM